MCGNEAFEESCGWDELQKLFCKSSFLLTTISHELYLRSTPPSRVSPWSAMPGWRLENTFFDWMHVVLLGVAKDAVAAGIKLLVMRGELTHQTLRADLKILTNWIKKEHKSETGPFGVIEACCFIHITWL